jgi:hypothetical protein
VRHRSPTCRAVFARAASMAGGEQRPGEPAHLVRAAFNILSEDRTCSNGKEPADVVPR